MRHNATPVSEPCLIVLPLCFLKVMFAASDYTEMQTTKLFFMSYIILITTFFVQLFVGVILNLYQEATSPLQCHLLRHHCPYWRCKSCSSIRSATIWWSSHVCTIFWNLFTGTTQSRIARPSSTTALPSTGCSR